MNSAQKVATEILKGELSEGAAPRPAQVAFYLSFGADIWAQDEKGRTVFELVLTHCPQETIDCLFTRDFSEVAYLGKTHPLDALLSALPVLSRNQGLKAALGLLHCGVSPEGWFEKEPMRLEQFLHHTDEGTAGRLLNGILERQPKLISTAPARLFLSTFGRCPAFQLGAKINQARELVGNPGAPDWVRTAVKGC
jgi:hypothetical protein